jgi:hypothetical protein
MTGASSIILQDDITVNNGPSTLQWFTLSQEDQGIQNDCIFQIQITNNHEIIALNTLLRDIPRNLQGLPKTGSGLIALLTTSSMEDGYPVYEITVSSKVPVSLYVSLTTKAHGRFEDNSFALVCTSDSTVASTTYRGCSKIIKFYSFIKEDQTTILKSSLRIEDLATYQ